MAVAITIFVAWLVAYGYASMRVERIPAEFKSVNDISKKQSLIRSYKRAAFIKKYADLERLLKLSLFVVLIIAVPVGGILFTLGYLVWRGMLKDTNYRGYNNYKKREKRQFTKMDEWVVIANQTILHK